MAVDRRVTTQDISWFLDLYRNDQLDLDPPYQRRSVWSQSDRRFFLDTIFRGYPSPSVFLHKQIVEGRTIYSVVDGKQRLETIIRFVKDEISIAKNFGDDRLAGKKWRSIKRDETLARTFWDYVVPVEFTNIIDDTNVVNEVFDRLNRNSRKLVEQELRHAKFDGWFITFVESEAGSTDWEDLGVSTKARARRMRDVQFLSELLIVLLKGEVSGFDQEEISEYYAEYDDISDLDFPFDEDDVVQRFNSTKRYLLALEREHSVVSKYASDFTDLYSLWALIALNQNRLPAVGEFASTYVAFMNEVSSYRDQEYLSEVLNGNKAPSFAQSLTYYQNSTGARTELPQRRQRNKALVLLFWGEYPNDEGS